MGHITLATNEWHDGNLQCFWMQLLFELKKEECDTTPKTYSRTKSNMQAFPRNKSLYVLLFLCGRYPNTTISKHQFVLLY